MKKLQRKLQKITKIYLKQKSREDILKKSCIKHYLMHTFGATGLVISKKRTHSHPLKTHLHKRNCDTTNDIKGMNCSFRVRMTTTAEICLGRMVWGQGGIKA